MKKLKGNVIPSFLRRFFCDIKLRSEFYEKSTPSSVVKSLDIKYLASEFEQQDRILYQRHLVSALTDNQLNFKVNPKGTTK